MPILGQKIRRRQGKCVPHFLSQDQRCKAPLAGGPDPSHIAIVGHGNKQTSASSSWQRASRDLVCGALYSNGQLDLYITHAARYRSAHEPCEKKEKPRTGQYRDSPRQDRRGRRQNTKPAGRLRPSPRRRHCSCVSTGRRSNGCTLLVPWYFLGRVGNGIYGDSTTRPEHRALRGGANAGIVERVLSLSCQGNRRFFRRLRSRRKHAMESMGVTIQCHVDVVDEVIRVHGETHHRRTRHSPRELVYCERKSLYRMGLELVCSKERLVRRGKSGRYCSASSCSR